LATMGLTTDEQKAVEQFRTDVVAPSMEQLVILDFWGICRSRRNTGQGQCRREQVYRRAISGAFDSNGLRDIPGAARCGPVAGTHGTATAANA